MTEGQIYLWPMWDWVAKNLLMNNEEIRNSILTCLSGVVVVESEPMDWNLIDQKSSLAIGSALKALKPEEFFELKEYFDFELVAKKKQNLQKTDIKLKKLRPSIQKLIKNETFSYEDGLRAITAIFKDHGIICDLFPDKHPHAVDFLCKTDQQKIVTIEFQIAHQTFFEKRALYYLCSVFSRQKKLRDTRYENVHPVIAVNLLAGEETPEWQDRDLIRYWALTDQVSKETMTYLTLVQYNLFKVRANFEKFWDKTPYEAKDKINPEMLKEWLEFFSHAHQLKELHQSHFEEINKAYDVVKVERLDQSTEELPDYIQFEIDTLKNKDFFIAQAIEKGREEGEQQMLIKMLKQHLEAGRPDQFICDSLFIDPMKLKEIKKLLEE
jgi:predicted transposase/invertase (TIGR01784 family)